MKSILYSELDEGDEFVHPVTGYTYRKTQGLMCENLDVFNEEQWFPPQDKVVLLDKA